MVGDLVSGNEPQPVPRKRSASRSGKQGVKAKRTVGSEVSGTLTEMDFYYTVDCNNLFSLAIETHFFQMRVDLTVHEIQVHSRHFE